MFVILLRFSANKSQASTLMEEHNQWIKRGFDDGVFLLAGSLQPGIGGSVVAFGETKTAIEQRVSTDPFVVHDVVTAEILDIEPKKVDSRLGFLLPG